MFPKKIIWTILYGTKVSGALCPIKKCPQKLLEILIFSKKKYLLCKCVLRVSWEKIIIWGIILSDFCKDILNSVGITENGALIAKKCIFGFLVNIIFWKVNLRSISNFLFFEIIYISWHLIFRLYPSFAKIRILSCVRVKLDSSIFYVISKLLLTKANKSHLLLETK